MIKYNILQTTLNKKSGGYNGGFSNVLELIKLDIINPTIPPNTTGINIDLINSKVLFI